MRVALGLSLLLMTITTAWAQTQPVKEAPPPVMPDLRALNPCMDYKFVPGKVDPNPPCWNTNPPPPVATKEIVDGSIPPPEVLLPIPYSHIDARPIGFPDASSTATQRALQAQRIREEGRKKTESLKGLTGEEWVKERKRLDDEAFKESMKVLEENSKAMAKPAPSPEQIK